MWHDSGGKPEMEDFGKRHPGHRGGSVLPGEVPGRGAGSPAGTAARAGRWSAHGLPVSLLPALVFTITAAHVGCGERTRTSEAGSRRLPSRLPPRAFPTPPHARLSLCHLSPYGYDPTSMSSNRHVTSKQETGHRELGLAHNASQPLPSAGRGLPARTVVGMNAGHCHCPAGHEGSRHREGA